MQFYFLFILKQTLKDVPVFEAHSKSYFNKASISNYSSYTYLNRTYDFFSQFLFIINDSFLLFKFVKAKKGAFWLEKNMC